MTLLIRHAETDLSGTFCGHTDPPVNARGQQQIATLITQFADTHIDEIHTSDLQRAHTTAQAIATRFGLSCHTHPALREINFGDWEGLTWATIEQRDKFYADRWLNEFPNLPTPNGETYVTFKTRILNAIHTITSTKKNTAIVTHGGVLRVILEDLHHHSPQQAWALTKDFCCIIPHEVHG